MCIVHAQLSWHCHELIAVVFFWPGVRLLSCVRLDHQEMSVVDVRETKRARTDAPSADADVVPRHREDHGGGVVDDHFEGAAATTTTEPRARHVIDIEPSASAADSRSVQGTRSRHQQWDWWYKDSPLDTIELDAIELWGSSRIDLLRSGHADSVATTTSANGVRVGEARDLQVTHHTHTHTHTHTNTHARTQ